MVTRSASGQATSPDHLVLPSGMDSSYYLPSSLSPPDRMSHKPYKCPIPNCPKGYGLPSQLKYHMAMRHGIRAHTLPNRGCGGADGSMPWRTPGETEQRNEVHACHVGPCTRQFKHSAGLGMPQILSLPTSIWSKFCLKSTIFVIRMGQIFLPDYSMYPHRSPPLASRMDYICHELPQVPHLGIY